MKAFFLPIVLQVTGFAVIIAEIFIPSMGLLSLVALGIFAWSLYMVYSSISMMAGAVMTALDVVLIPGFIVLGMKALAASPLALRRELSKKDGVVSQNDSLNALTGKEGIAVTDLRPAGMAQIESRRMDVVTDGEYIESGTPVVVTAVTGNRIVVEQKE